MRRETTVPSVLLFGPMAAAVAAAASAGPVQFTVTFTKAFSQAPVTGRLVQLMDTNLFGDEPRESGGPGNLFNPQPFCSVAGARERWPSGGDSHWRQSRNLRTPSASSATACRWGCSNRCSAGGRQPRAVVRPDDRANKPRGCRDVEEVRLAADARVGLEHAGPAPRGQAPRPRGERRHVPPGEALVPGRAR